MGRRLAIAVTVVVTVLMSALYVATDSVALRTGLSQASIVALPVVVLWTALRATPRHRPALLVVFAACVSYVAAEAVSVAITSDGVAPYPNPGEVFISLGGVLMLVALAMVVGRRPRLGRAERLDVGIAAVGVVLLFAQAGLLGLVGPRSGGAPVAVAGPLLVLAVAYLAIAVVCIGQPGGAAPGTSMLVGAMAMVLSDVAFFMATLDGVDQDGRLSDVGYIITRGSFVVMALQLGRESRHRYRLVDRYRVVVAGAVALLTPLGAVIGARTNPGGPEWLTVLALVLPVCLLTWRAVLTVGRLTEEAGRDPLTGLDSRRSVMDVLERCCASGPGFVLVVCDLDGFKQVNDRHGHAAGDRVLVDVAHLLQDSAPPGSTVARLGGDEFAVLVPLPPGTSEQTGLADGVVADLSSRFLPALATLAGPAAGVGASLGAAAGGPGSDPHTLLVGADRAMYSVKQAARPSGLVPQT